MVGKKIEPRREARIIDEIIVDAHTDDERAMSWYYYLESELRFPVRGRVHQTVADLPTAQG